LQELGVLSGKTRNLLEDMAKMKGPRKPSASAMLDVLIADFKRFEGTMSTLVGTGDQLFSNLVDIGIWSLKTLGDEIKELAKDRMSELTDAMIKLSKDGTLKKWGENINSILIGVEGKVRNLIDWVKKFQSADKGKRSKMVEEVTSSFFDSLSIAFDKLKPKLLETGEIIATGFLNALKKGFKGRFWDESVELKGFKEFFGKLFGDNSDKKTNDNATRPETTVVTPAPEVTVNVPEQKGVTPDVVVNVPPSELPDFADPNKLVPTTPALDPKGAKAFWENAKEGLKRWWGKGGPVFYPPEAGKEPSFIEKMADSIIGRWMPEPDVVRGQDVIQDLLRIQIKWQKRIADINKKKKKREERDEKDLPPMRPTPKRGETMAQWLKDIEKDKKINKRIISGIIGEQGVKDQAKREAEERAYAKRFLEKFEADPTSFMKNEMRIQRRISGPAFDLPPVPVVPPPTGFRNGAGNVFSPTTPVPVRIMNPEYVEKE
jgi:hypothetical protein